MAGLPFHYGSHCGSCKVSGDCIRLALSEGRGALELCGGNPEELRAIRAHCPDIGDIEALADSPEAALEPAFDAISGNRAQLRRLKQRAAARQCQEPPAGGSQQQLGKVQLLFSGPPSKIPFPTVDSPASLAVSVHVFITWDPSVRRVVACAAHLAFKGGSCRGSSGGSGGTGGSTGLSLQCHQSSTIVRVIDRPWSPLLVHKGNPKAKSSPAASTSDDDEAEKNMLSGFMEDLNKAIITPHDHAQAVCHIYFMSRAHASQLSSRLSSLGLADHYQALGQLLGARDAIPGEQLLVTFLEEEAKQRFALPCLGFDLYSMSQADWGAVAGCCHPSPFDWTAPMDNSVALDVAFRFGCCDTWARDGQPRIRNTSAQLPMGYFWAYWDSSRSSPEIKALLSPHNTIWRGGGEAQGDA